MKSLLLVYSDSCPNYRPARQMLEEFGLPFSELNQDNLHEGCWGKKFSSPTLLARFGDDDQLLFLAERLIQSKELVL